jgi:hypothetical protein
MPLSNRPGIFFVAGLKLFLLLLISHSGPEERLQAELNRIGETIF